MNTIQNIIAPNTGNTSVAEKKNAAPAKTDDKSGSKKATFSNQLADATAKALEVNEKKLVPQDEVFISDGVAQLKAKAHLPEPKIVAGQDPQIGVNAKLKQAGLPLDKESKDLSDKSLTNTDPIENMRGRLSNESGMSSLMEAKDPFAAETKAAAVAQAAARSPGRVVQHGQKLSQSDLGTDQLSWRGLEGDAEVIGTTETAVPSAQRLSGEDYLSARNQIRPNAQNLASLSTGLAQTSPENASDPFALKHSPEGSGKLMDPVGDAFAPSSNGINQYKPVLIDVPRDSDSIRPALTPTVFNVDAPKPAPLEVNGLVVKGAWAKDRFSSETLMGMSDGIHSAALRGGGEVRIRLKPESLGELNVQVRTVGNQVGLKIQASDAKARDILEESLKYLQDSLASKNLSLTKVDLGVAPTMGQDTGAQLGRFGSSSDQFTDSWFNHDLSQNNRGETGYSDGRHENVRDESREDRMGYSGQRGAAPPGLVSGKFGNSRSANPNGRLDIRA